jgi:hypothetical protein
MEYRWAGFFHILGVVLMGSGLIGVWLADIRSRQHRELIRFSEALRYISVFYDGLVVPGALMVLASGAWFTTYYYGGWDFTNFPWLSGMIILFALEFIEGNTITRQYFIKLRHITKTALKRGTITTELEKEKARLVPSVVFHTH